jgi:hypothetical protein
MGLLEERDGKGENYANLRLVFLIERSHVTLDQ